MFFKRALEPAVDGPDFCEFRAQRVEPIPGRLHAKASQLTGRLVGQAAGAGA